MKCPACQAHTTSFLNLLEQERQLYVMPFIRTCPHCGAKIRLGLFPLVGFVGLLLFLHAGIEVGALIARRYGFDERLTVITTVLILAIPFFVLLFLLWKHTWYSLR